MTQGIFSMIQKDSFRAMLLSLGFTEQKSVMSKFFPHADCELKVDFAQEKLMYKTIKA